MGERYKGSPRNMFVLWHSGRQIQNTILCTLTQRGGSSSRLWKAWPVRTVSQGLHWEGCEQWCMQEGPSWESLLCKWACLQGQMTLGTSVLSTHSCPQHQLAPEGIQNFGCWNLLSVYICSRNNQKLLLTHHYHNIYLIKQENRKRPIQTEGKASGVVPIFQQHYVRHKFCVLDK